jgi:hypothetical protein
MKENIVIFEDKNGNVELRADIERDTIWAMQDQIAKLFDGSKQTVSRHLIRIFDEGELDEKSVVKEYLTTADDGKKYKAKFYNLDAIIAVGYRVNSKKATQFRIWATVVLREYLKQGYALNHHKLEKSPEAVEGLDETLALMASPKYHGKLKGKLVFKLTKDMEPKK